MSARLVIESADGAPLAGPAIATTATPSPRIVADVGAGDEIELGELAAVTIFALNATCVSTASGDVRVTKSGVDCVLTAMSSVQVLVTQFDGKGVLASCMFSAPEAPDQGVPPRV